MKKKKLKLKSKVTYKIVLFNSLLVMIILFFAAYYIYSYNRNISYYNGNKYYSYITIYKMSSMFATIDNKELHFITDINKKNYVILIENKDKSKYQSIINYTYGKEKNKTTKKVYVYPQKFTNKILELSIKYINDYLPYKQKIDIDKENYDNYITKYYLDTTIKTNYKFNYIVFVLFLLVVIIIFITITYILKYKKKETINKTLDNLK